MSILSAIGAVIGFFIITVLLILLIVLLRVLVLLYCHRCKQCGRIMDYKGLIDDDGNGHYLFYCSKCFRWESIPTENFLKRFMNLNKSSK